MSVIERSTPVLENKCAGSCKESVLCRMNILWILLYIIGVGIFMIGTPKYVDDLWYLMDIRPWFEKLSLIEPTNTPFPVNARLPLREVWSTWISHFGNDNSRLANLTATFLLVFPKQLGSGLSVCLWLFAILSGFKLSGVSWRHSVIVPIGLLLFTIVPWSQQIGALDYQCNYVWATALMLSYISFVLRSESEC